MAYDAHLSFVTFLYEDIQWSDDNTFAGIFPTAFIPGYFSDARNLPNTSNVGVPGMWMYRVDSLRPPGLDVDLSVCL